MSKPQSGIEELIDSHHGRFIPELFVRSYANNGWDVKPEDIAILKNPEHELYDEAWNDVLCYCHYVDSNGNTWELWQDGDLFAICTALMSEEEYWNFFGEQREAL